MIFVLVVLTSIAVMNYFLVCLWAMLIELLSLPGLINYVSFLLNDMIFVQNTVIVQPALHWIEMYTVNIHNMQLWNSNPVGNNIPGDWVKWTDSYNVMCHWYVVIHHWNIVVDTLHGMSSGQRHLALQVRVIATIKTNSASYWRSVNNH